MRSGSKYWRGSESHNAYSKAKIIFKDKIKAFEVTPISSQIFEKDRIETHASEEQKTPSKANK